MNFGAIVKAFDTVMVIREAAKRLKGEPPSPAGGLATTPSHAPGSLPAHLEAPLTNVVVAALKEAFNRDQARMDLERAQLEDQRRRAEDAMRAELRRQAADREVGRLRLLAGTALVGWIASVVMLIARLGSASTVSRVVIAGAWLLLLGSLGAAFTAQGRVSASAVDATTAPHENSAGTAALWLLIAGLALAAISLLF